MPNIVILDGYTLNPGDLDWKVIQQMGAVEIYDRTPEDKVVERAREAAILLVNKIILSEEVLAKLPNLKCIVVMASGYNNIDTKAARARSIAVCNASGYSTPGVAQHVFAMMLALTNRVELHHQSVEQGDWAKAPDFCYMLQPIHELEGKTLGIYGLGKIGNRVADLALAFGMQVLATHKHPVRDAREGVEFVALETLFRQSDFISLHAPLTKENNAIVSQNLLSQMRSTAYLLNTGRGGLIAEKDLKWALENDKLAGAVLDVLSSEPPPKDHLLIGVKNCLITPHIAWASVESRQRLLKITANNIRGYVEGKLQNVVN